MIISILVFLYKIRVRLIRKIIESLICKIDGSIYWSVGLRTIYRKYYNLEVGYGSYGAFDINKFGTGSIIGNYCSVGAEVKYLSGNHPVEQVSTHPFFYNKSLGYVSKDRIKRESLTVGHDVWIGYRAIITKGCKIIGNGAVIGAGSVVTKNVPPYAIVAGNPAKIIKYRFDDDTIKKIEMSQWWNYKRADLIKVIEFNDNVDKFTSIINEMSNEKQ